MRAALRRWNEGRYDECYERPLRERVLQRESKASPEKKMNKQFQRAIHYMKQGRVSRAIQALEAAEVMPGTEATLDELRRLCPPAFVPAACLRRAALKDRIAERVATGQEYTFQEEAFNKAAASMPISSTTWGTASLIKSTAITRDGVNALRWWATEIANARVPQEVKPLLLDAQIIALSKESTMGAAKTAAERAAKAAAGCRTCGGGGCDVCGRCRPPALWAGEHPNARLSSSRDPAPAVDDAALAMASRMTTAPHPRLGCTSGPDGGPCAACRDAPEREADGF